MASDIMEKTAKILALIENASTDEEREAATIRLQVLQSKHSIDLAVARSKMYGGATPVPVQKGVPMDFSKNNKKPMIELYSRIASANDVRIDISRASDYVWAYGFDNDIEATNLMFSQLSGQMVNAAEDYLASGEYKAETQKVWSNKFNAYIDKPIDGRIARSNFYRAFVSRIGMRLFEAKKKVETEAISEDKGTELVLVTKNEKVKDFYKSTSTARGSWSGSSSTGYSASARKAGDAAGKSASIGSQGSISGSKKEIEA